MVVKDLGLNLSLHFNGNYTNLQNKEKKKMKKKPFKREAKVPPK